MPDLLPLYSVTGWDLFFWMVSKSGSETGSKNGSVWGSKMGQFWGQIRGGVKNGSIGVKMGENGRKRAFFCYFWGFFAHLIRRRLENRLPKRAQKRPQKKKSLGGGTGVQKSALFWYGFVRGPKLENPDFWPFLTENWRNGRFSGSNWANWGVQLNGGVQNWGSIGLIIGGQIWGC